MDLSQPSLWDGFTPGGRPENTPIAVGGDLSVPNLYGAYRRGIFPWPPESEEARQFVEREFGALVRSGGIPSLDNAECPCLDIPWWRPEPRSVLPVSSVHVSRSLRSFIRRSGWSVTADAAFRDVMRACARDERDSWISDRMITAYCALAELGVAHSVEVWDETGRLVGGVYGVRAGKAFTGESMFHKRTNASKVALVALASRFAEVGGAVIDTQFESEHLKSMGAITMPSSDFEELCGAEATGPLGSRRSRVSDLLPGQGPATVA